MNKLNVIPNNSPSNNTPCDNTLSDHSSPQATQNSPWYKDGLRFKCTECGQCCTGQPGYVWVTQDEIKAIADHLGLPVDKFMRQYTRQKDNRYALIELKSRNYDCIFLKDNKCSIYQHRPSQCKTFPWWPLNLKTEESWKAAAAYCEGINDQAILVPLAEIEKNYSPNSPS